MWLLDHRVVLFLTFWGTPILFSIVTAPVCIPNRIYTRVPFVAHPGQNFLLPAFDFCYSDMCEVVSHCGFDLYFPDYEWCWASFHVLISHLYVVFGERSIHVLIFNYLFFECCISNPLSDMSFENVFSYFIGCLLVLLIVYLAVQKLFM